MSMEPIGWEQAEDSFLAPSLAAGDATGWFDKLYTAGAEGRVTMPWSRTEPHPLLVQWAQRTGQTGAGRTAVVIGCALGADAEFVAGLGFTTTAFDVSPTAIQLARERHPRTAVRYVTVDLLHVPAAWQRAFDLVVEIITLQALPPELHPRAASAVRELVAGSGTLLVIGALPDESAVSPPWVLTRAEIEGLASGGLDTVAIETMAMPGNPAEPRWRAEYRRR
jgi:threonine dehydrogenase-like Zn-dependent dehydrogenase